MLILGVDGGVTHIGIAVMEVGDDPPRLLESAVLAVRFKAQAESYAAVLRPSLLRLVGSVDRVGAEAMTFFSRRQERASLHGGAPPMETFSKVGVVIGCLTMVAAELGRPYRAMSPQALKAAATGSRVAGKQDIIAAVRGLFPDFQDHAGGHRADAVVAGLACWAPEVLLAARAGAGARIVAQ